MANFHISISCACDLSPDQITALGARFFSTRFIGLSDEPNTIDEYERACKKIANGKVRPTPITTEKVEAYFDEMLEQKNKSLLHISPSSLVSDEGARALRATRNEMIKFPRQYVYVLLTSTVGAGMQPLFYEMVKLNDGTRSIEEAFVALTELERKVVSLCVKKEPNFITVTSAQSTNKLLFKSRSEAQTAKRIADAFLSTSSDTLYISHRSHHSLALKIAERVQEADPKRKVEISHMSATSMTAKNSFDLTIGYVEQ
ncbi:MAG: hypothetical protein J6B79_07965 [Clostridia bacterium]|nr:hypothetical protein [Clostridia bacterium]MBQ7224758.1 hypothetical protein [Clostridia bacterium]